MFFTSLVLDITLTELDRKKLVKQKVYFTQQLPNLLIFLFCEEKIFGCNLTYSLFISMY